MRGGRRKRGLCSDIVRRVPGAAAGALTLGPRWGVPSVSSGFPAEAPGGAARAPRTPGGDPIVIDDAHRSGNSHRRYVTSSRSCTYFIGQSHLLVIIRFFFLLYVEL